MKFLDQIPFSVKAVSGVVLSGLALTHFAVYRLELHNDYIQAKNEACEQAQKRGEAFGESKGYDRGVKEGYEKGVRKGYDDGFERGRGEGFSNGKAVGIVEGTYFTMRKINKMMDEAIEELERKRPKAIRKKENKDPI